MVIVDLSKRKFVCFSEIDIGEIFRCDGYTCLKIENKYEAGKGNAFDIMNKRTWEFNSDAEVEHIPSELFLHEPGWRE